MFNPDFNVSVYSTFVNSPDNSNLDSGTGFGATFRADIRHHLAVSVSLGTYEQEADLMFLSSGDLTVTSLLVGGEFYWMQKKRLDSYLTAGLGLYNVENDFKNDFTDSLANFGYIYEEKIQSDIGPFYGAGMNVYLNKRQSFSLGVDYLLFQASPEVRAFLRRASDRRLVGFATENYDIGGDRLNVGVKFYF